MPFERLRGGIPYTADDVAAIRAAFRVGDVPTSTEAGVLNVLISTSRETVVHVVTSTPGVFDGTCTGDMMAAHPVMGAVVMVGVFIAVHLAVATRTPLYNATGPSSFIDCSPLVFIVVSFVAAYVAGGVAVVLSAVLCLF